jgi:hypothetical protein
MMFKDHGRVPVSVLMVKNAAPENLKKVTGGILEN